MVNIRLLSIVLGFLFVVLGVRDCPSALAQDEAKTRNGLAAIDRDIYDVSAGKELVDDHGATGISMRKLWLQGRKMAAHMVGKEYDQKEIKGMDKLETWKISGKSSRAEASKNSPERFDHRQDENDQKNINMLDRKTLKSASLGIPRSKPAVSHSNPKQMQPQDSKTVKTIASLESSSMSKKEVARKPLDSDQRDEIQRLLIATKEIENMMQKDYKGMSKPRRKPPINNHQPRH